MCVCVCVCACVLTQNYGSVIKSLLLLLQMLVSTSPLDFGLISVWCFDAVLLVIVIAAVVGILVRRWRSANK